MYYNCVLSESCLYFDIDYNRDLYCTYQGKINIYSIITLIPPIACMNKLLYTQKNQTL